MKPSNPTRPAPYSTAGPAFLDQGVVHLTRHRDVLALVELERQGKITQDYTYLLAALERLGAPVPADRENISITWRVPWVHGAQRLDGAPGRHGALRRVLQRYFGHRAVQDLAPHVDEIVTQVLREAVQEELEHRGDHKVGRVDLARLLDTVAFRAMSALAGFPYGSSADEQFIRDQLQKNNSAATFVDTLAPSSPELRAYIQRVVDRHEEGSGGLLDEIVAAHGRDDLTLEERDGLIFGCWLAGQDTTATLLSMVVGLVDEHGLAADVVEHLTDQNDAWFDDLVEETLRYSAPFSSNIYVCTEDVELGGQVVPGLTLVQAWWSAANRDPDAFGPDADLFRPGREASSSNLAFGWGPHRCVGAALARMETRVVTRRLYAALPELRVTRWHRLARVVDLVDELEVEYDLQAAARRLEAMPGC